MSATRLLVTGAGGMVGSYVSTVFKDVDVHLTGRRELDVRDAAAVQAVMASVRPDVVLHLAAATDVDRCEEDPAWAYHTNAIGTENLALACRARDAVMILASTGAVFAGDKPEPYVEFDTPAPLSVYGRSKLAAEQVVTALVPRHFIVRAGWMIGGGPRDKKFVGKMVQLIRDGQTRLRAVDDKLGTPVYARDFLAGVRQLLDSGRHGLYHVVNEAMVSRYEVALAIRDVLGRADVEVNAVSSAHFPLPAPRGRSEALGGLKLQLLGIPGLRPWTDALRDYVLNELVPGASASA